MANVVRCWGGAETCLQAFEIEVVYASTQALDRAKAYQYCWRTLNTEDWHTIDIERKSKSDCPMNNEKENLRLQGVDKEQTSWLRNFRKLARILTAGLFNVLMNNVRGTRSGIRRRSQNGNIVLWYLERVVSKMSGNDRIRITKGIFRSRLH